MSLDLNVTGKGNETYCSLASTLDEFSKWGAHHNRGLQGKQESYFLLLWLLERTDICERRFLINDVFVGGDLYSIYNFIYSFINALTLQDYGGNPYRDRAMTLTQNRKIAWFWKMSQLGPYFTASRFQTLYLCSTTTAVYYCPPKAAERDSSIPSGIVKASEWMNENAFS